MANKAIDHLYDRCHQARYPTHFDDCRDLGVNFHWATPLKIDQDRGLMTVNRRRNLNKLINIRFELSSERLGDCLGFDHYFTRQV